MYICKHFNLHELVYPELYKQYEEKQWALWKIFNPNILITADRLREFLKCKVIINNWYWGGSFRYSGLRPIDCKVGAPLSDHKFAHALDLKFESNIWNPERLREYMKSIGCFEEGFSSRIDDEAYPFILITSIEWNPGMTWFHVSCSNYLNTEKNCIRIIRTK